MIGDAPVSHGCLLCGYASLQEIAAYRRLPRVTSDCRPWAAGGRLTVCTTCGGVQKLPDPDFIDEIGRIYSSYAIYYQSAGAEQPIFCGDQAMPVARSSRLLDYLDSTLALPECMSVLDFGCGTGTALKTFSERHPNWLLYGSEQSDRGLSEMTRIRGFRQLFTVQPSEIPLRLDLITLIHALEHVLEPVGTLVDLTRLLNEEGHLFIEVPDAGRSPYDLTIADHLLHFSLQTLAFAAFRAGCTTVTLSDSVLPKELSWIGGRSVQSPTTVAPDPGSTLARVRMQVAWLQDQVEMATRIAAESHFFGVFGTSISGTWLHGALGSQVAFFVDEDPGRIGRQHMGVPVLAPDAIPAGADVYVPLIPAVADAVLRRLANGRVRFHAPRFSSMG